MDFRTQRIWKKHTDRFIYLLPIVRRKALVEMKKGRLCCANHYSCKETVFDVHHFFGFMWPSEKKKQSSDIYFQEVILRRFSSCIWHVRSGNGRSWLSTSSFSFIALTKNVPFYHIYNHCSTNHLHFFRSFWSCFLLSAFSCECKIFQAQFVHYVPWKFQLSFRYYVKVAYMFSIFFIVAQVFTSCYSRYPSIETYFCASDRFFICDDKVLHSSQYKNT